MSIEYENLHKPKSPISFEVSSAESDSDGGGQEMMLRSVLTGIDKIEIIDVPKPFIVNDNDVLIRMTVVGICGSDIHYYSTGRIGSQVVQYPFTVGHEGAGVVEAVGAAVTSVKPGDPIAVEPSVACGHCGQCLAGRPHTCENNLFLGCPGQIEGNLAEYIVMPETQCIKLQGGLQPDHGATSEPLAIGCYAVKQARIKPTNSIAIIGFGPIGMSVLQMAKANGVETILVSEKINERGSIARKNGAKWVVNPLEENVLETADIQFDVVFECCGQQDAMDTAVELLKPGGKLMVVGIPEFDRWSFCADVARRKELSFTHIRRQNDCTHQALDMIKEGEVDGSAMITHHFRFDQIAEAFDMVKNYRDGVMKAMIHFG
ncbi:MAG: alcohol dehydrogenase catalytic domain-containing protein [Prolixibacteraceae bacterium]|jgi:L-iditol 2-dehydrogenase|nr:alcohol dehydrogenase catalytic domain-containing protein [Prolixibacteraceae bacterium]